MIHIAEHLPIDTIWRGEVLLRTRRDYGLLFDATDCHVSDCLYQYWKMGCPVEVAAHWLADDLMGDEVESENRCVS